MTIAISLPELLGEVCRVTGVSHAKLTSATRKRAIVRLRQAIVFTARRRTARYGRVVSYPRLGHLLGGFDHTTMIHADHHFLDMLRYGEPRALRAYKIVIRAYVRLEQQQEARRRRITEITAPTESYEQLAA